MKAEGRPQLILSPEPFSVGDLSGPRRLSFNSLQEKGIRPYGQNLVIS